MNFARLLRTTLLALTRELLVVQNTSTPSIIGVCGLEGLGFLDSCRESVEMSS
jgi:hypothetical protein